MRKATTMRFIDPSAFQVYRLIDVGIPKSGEKWNKPVA